MQARVPGGGTCSAPCSLLSPITAREDTEGADSVAPQQGKGVTRLGGTGQRRSRTRVEACEQAAQDTGELG